MYLLRKEEIQTRLKAKRSLYLVAQETGLTYPTVHKFAADKGVPTYDTLVTLSEYLMEGKENGKSKQANIATSARA